MCFHNRPTKVDLKEVFYPISDNEIGIVDKAYRRLTVDRLNGAAYHELLDLIRSAIARSEQLAVDFYNDNKEEVEPLYSLELDHYSVGIDLLAYAPNAAANGRPALELDVLIECRDKDGQPIFMYDSRGCCCVSFELNASNELIVSSVS